MASGLIGAGMLAGLGQGVQEAGKEAVAYLTTEQLQARREQFERERDERLLETKQQMQTEALAAQRGMHQETLGMQAVTETMRTGSAEKIASAREAGETGRTREEIGGRLTGISIQQQGEKERAKDYEAERTFKAQEAEKQRGFEASEHEKDRALKERNQQKDLLHAEIVNRTDFARSGTFALFTPEQQSDYLKETEHKIQEAKDLFGIAGKAPSARPFRNPFPVAPSTSGEALAGTIPGSVETPKVTAPQAPPVTETDPEPPNQMPRSFERLTAVQKEEIRRQQREHDAWRLRQEKRAQQAEAERQAARRQRDIERQEREHSGQY